MEHPCEHLTCQTCGRVGVVETIYAAVGPRVRQRVRFPCKCLGSILNEIIRAKRDEIVRSGVAPVLFPLDESFEG